MVNTTHERFFFEHYGLANQDLETYLAAAALSAGGDYADLYFEYLTSTSLMVDESLVKSASQGISAGCGVRVVSGERTGYAYTDDLSPQRILHAARTAALIASAPAKIDGWQDSSRNRRAACIRSRFRRWTPTLRPRLNC
jgi:TldD protein